MADLLSLLMDDLLIDHHKPQPSAQLNVSEITTPDILKGVVSSIVSKALLSPAFSTSLAELCSDLNAQLPPFPSADPGGEEITFKQLLSEDVLRAFKRTATLRQEISQMNAAEQLSERREKEKFIKLITLANNSFIIELCKHRAISEAIVCQILYEDLLGLDDETSSGNEILSEMKGKTISILEHYSIVYKWEMFWEHLLNNLEIKDKEFMKESFVSIVATMEEIPPCVESIANRLVIPELRNACVEYGSRLVATAIKHPKVPINFGVLMGHMVLSGCMDFKAVEEVLKNIEFSCIRKSVFGEVKKAVGSSSTGNCVLMAQTADVVACESLL